MSTVYLLHFVRPISPDHTTQHYIGTAVDLDARLALHASGRGARLCAVAAERGIGFSVAALWNGGHLLERQLKRRKNAPKLCPFCNGALEFDLADISELEF